ncbi:NfeD family protein [Streptobacillus felis]|uniref:NfeD family protein n=1 Tax=Streptobacillus felis TaxID=1384509 RepID=UPI000830DF3D|nr:NfeD family protein [Streptobacillus felis]
MTNVYVWLGLFITFILIEIATYNLVTIWLAFSALIVSILSIWFDNPPLQIFIFAVLVVIFLLYTRPILNKYFIKDKFHSDFKGHKVVIVDKENGTYIVKFKDSKWTAISNEEFNTGDVAYIEAFEGNKILIKK